MRGDPCARGCGHAGVSATSRAIHAAARVGGAGVARAAAGGAAPTDPASAAASAHAHAARI
jgi:hypothetical protein